MKSKTEKNKVIGRLVFLFSLLVILGSTQALSAQESMVNADCEEMTEVVLQEDLNEENPREMNADDFDTKQKKNDGKLQQLNPLSYLFPKFENNGFDLNLSERFTGFLSRTIEKVLSK